MSTNRWLRGLWVVAAGVGITLAASQGIAAAESGSIDGGAGPSSSQSAAADTPVDTATDSTVDDAKGHGVSQHSTTGTKNVDTPASTVSASTVTIRHAEAATAEAATSEAATSETAAAETDARATSVSSKPATSPETITPEKTAPEKVVADEAPPAITPTSAVVTPGTTPANESAPVAEVAKDVSAIRTLGAITPAPQPGPLATVVISLLSAFGLLPPAPPAPVAVVGVPNQAVPGSSAIGGVTGVAVGSSSLSIPVGSSTYTGAADWYFPTQADGTVQAQGVMLLQHGFLGSKSWYSALARDLAQRTNSIVVVPNIPSFPFFTCAGCTLSGVPMQQGVAALFVDPNRTALNASAAAAGYRGVLPENFVLTGHSAGGGLAAAAGGFYTDPVTPQKNDLLGVVMYDGVSSNGTFAGALASLNARAIPVYQIAAPPQPWNANGQTTTDLVALRPGQFVGAVLTNGSHVDSLIGGAPIIDFFSQLLIKPSPAGNTQAVYTLANGWINDMYAGRGPADARYGSYGDSDQHVVLGPTSAVVLGSPPVAKVNRHLGKGFGVGRTVSDALLPELLDRASVEGVRGSITVTPQPAAVAELSSENRV